MAAGRFSTSPGCAGRRNRPYPATGAAVGFGHACPDESPHTRHRVAAPYGEYAGEHDARNRPTPQVVGGGDPVRPPSGSPKPRITKVLARGNRQVPEVALAGVRPHRTVVQGHRPAWSPTSRTGCFFFAQLARSAPGCPESRHPRYFSMSCRQICSAAGIPIQPSIAAISDGQVNAGRHIVDDWRHWRHRARLTFGGAAAAAFRLGRVETDDNPACRQTVVTAGTSSTRCPNATRSTHAVPQRKNPFPAACPAVRSALIPLDRWPPTGIRNFLPRAAAAALIAGHNRGLRRAGSCWERVRAGW